MIPVLVNCFQLGMFWEQVNKSSTFICGTRSNFILRWLIFYNSDLTAIDWGKAEKNE